MRTQIVLFALVFVGLYVAGVSSSSRAADDDAVAWSAQRFDRWVESFKGTDAANAAEAMLSRLVAGRDVPDETVRAIVTARIRLDGHAFAVDRDMPNEQKFARSLKLIAQVRAAIYKRPMLDAWLRSRAGEAHDFRMEYAEAARECAAAQGLWEPAHVELDLARVRNLVRLGGVYLRVGSKNLADKAFVEAQGYPYFQIRDAELIGHFRDEHLLATGGLLQARRGKPALRDIRLWPVDEARFREELDLLIREAEGGGVEIEEAEQAPVIN